MTKKQIIAFIKAEIKWCETAERTMPEDWHDGFIAGLKQSIRLIKSAKVKIILAPKQEEGK